MCGQKPRKASRWSEALINHREWRCSQILREKVRGRTFDVLRENGKGCYAFILSNERRYVGWLRFAIKHDESSSHY
jgi:hypothetical protein